MSPEEIAQVCHEANRALQHLAGETVGPPWVFAPDWMRESAVKGVAEAEAGATPEQLHVAWCIEKQMAGWVWGPAKDAQARVHPCLVPYEELPESQRRKDAVFAAIVAALSPRMES